MSWTVRNPNSKLFRDWTKEREDRLRSLWDEGLTGSEIAEDLKGVTRCAVIGKARRMGLASRDTGKKEAPVTASPIAKTSLVRWNAPIVSRTESRLLAQRPAGEMTKSQLRAELAQAVRNTAAMPVE